jgi:hypothetical protein
MLRRIEPGHQSVVVGKRIAWENRYQTLCGHAAPAQLLKVGHRIRMECPVVGCETVE